MYSQMKSNEQWGKKVIKNTGNTSHFFKFFLFICIRF